MDKRTGGNPHTQLPKTKIEVEVTAKPGAGGGIDYSHRVNSHANGGKIELPKDSGPYKLVFELEDETDLGLRFDAAGPFFCDVSHGGKCPGTIDRQQFMVESCEDDELTVVDWNYGEAKTLHYQLNVTDRYGQPQPPYDPIIQNGGGVKS